MTVKLLLDWPDSRDGKQYRAGNLLTTDAGTEAGLVAANMATSNLTGGTAYVAPQVQKQRYPVNGETDPVTGVIRNAAGDTVMSGLLDNGKWANPPSIFRLLCNGSGTITLDAKDAAGNISLGAFSVTLSGAVNQIEYPYCGDAVVQVRANTTGTATAQVI